MHSSVEESLDELYAIHHPHDALFRSVFGDPELAGELLRSVLPAELGSAIDWTAMHRIDGSFVDEALAGHQADLLFAATAGGRPALLYLLLEHKAEEDRFTAFQLLRYVVRIWERCRRENPQATLLPAVLPVVFHHGRHPWRGPCDLAALLDTAGLPAAFVASQPTFSFAIDDLTAHSESDVRHRGLSVRALLPLLHLQWLRRRSDTAILLRSWLPLFRDLLRTPGGRPIAIQLTWYTAAVSEHPPAELRRVYRQLGPVMEKHYMSTADQILSRGFREGREKGMQHGLQEGLQQGLQQGLREGMAQVLLHQIEQRFGPLDETTTSRIRAATPDELQQLATRLLTAPTLAAALGS